MIDDARIEEIWAEMNGYVLELSLNPSSRGPRYLQDLIATCRNYLNNVSLRLSELHHAKFKSDRALKDAEALYEMDFDRLMASDESVKKLANVDDRKSTAKYILRDRLKEIHAFKDRVRAIDAVYRTVVQRRDSLVGTMSTIKEQRRQMEIELSTGSFYGDERTYGTLSVGIGGNESGDGIDENEIQKAIAESQVEEATLADVDFAAPPPELAAPASPPLLEAHTTPMTGDEEALALFLGEEPASATPPPSAEPEELSLELVDFDSPSPASVAIARPAPPAVQSAKSALQTEVEDLNHLLDAV